MTSRHVPLLAQNFGEEAGHEVISVAVAVSVIVVVVVDIEVVIVSWGKKCQSSWIARTFTSRDG
jgi:hypothetical protein